MKCMDADDDDDDDARCDTCVMNRAVGAMPCRPRVETVQKLGPLSAAISPARPRRDSVSEH